MALFAAWRASVNSISCIASRRQIHWAAMPIGSRAKRGTTRAVREDFLHSSQRAGVVRVAEDWSQNHVICDVEVRIAGRQTIKVTCAGARPGYNSGHRQSDNLK